MPLLLESKDRAFAVFQTLEHRKIHDTVAQNLEVQGTGRFGGVRADGWQAVVIAEEPVV